MSVATKLDISKKQSDVLSYLYEYTVSSGFAPTIADIRERMGVVSNQAVLDMLTTLERKKFIHREEGSARSIRILEKGFTAIGKPPLVPIRGTSYGGAFTETHESLGEWRQLSSEVRAMTDRCYFVRISGDSMIGAGIANGCLVLVKEEQAFASNDIVLARAPDGTTVKRYVTQDRPPYLSLRPENPAYPIIPCGPDTELIGRVIAIIRDDGVLNPIINTNR